MPAKKSARQSLKHYYRNRSVRSTTRTTVNAALRAVEAADADQAKSAVRRAISVLDKAVKKGFLHQNNASRHKSQLAIRLNRMQGLGSS